MSFEARLALVLLPKGKLGQQLGEILHDWHNLGIISDALLIPLEINDEVSLEDFKVKAVAFSKLGSGEPIPLFDYIGMRAYKTRELVAPWLLKDQEPDAKLASYAYLLSKKIRNTLSQGSGLDKTHSHFCSTLLSVSAIGTVKENQIVENFVGYEDFSQNVFVSPEIQATAGAGSIPVSSDMANFAEFIAAQIATVAGLWAGNPEPLSTMIEQSEHSKSGNVIVLRGSVSAIMARDLANRIISSALAEAADPNIDPYSDSRGNRPVSIKDGHAIQNAIEINRDRIINENPGILKWEAQGELEKPNFRIPLAARLRHIYEFIKTTFHDMIYWTKAYFGNRFSDAVGTLAPTEDLYPEPDYGLNRDVLLNFKKIKQAEEDVQGIESVAAANIAWEQRASLWKRIRGIVFSSLDTAAISKSETKTDNIVDKSELEDHSLDFEKGNFGNLTSSKVNSATDPSKVLPHVNYATSDPYIKFKVTPEVAGYLDAKPDVDFQEARHLRQVVADQLAKLDAEILAAKTLHEQITTEQEEVEEFNNDVDIENFESSEDYYYADLEGDEEFAEPNENLENLNSEPIQVDDTEYLDTPKDSSVNESSSEEELFSPALSSKRKGRRAKETAIESHESEVPKPQLKPKPRSTKAALDSNFGAEEVTEEKPSSRKNSARRRKIEMEDSNDQ